MGMGTGENIVSFKFSKDVKNEQATERRSAATAAKTTRTNKRPRRCAQAPRKAANQEGTVLNFPAREGPTSERRSAVKREIKADIEARYGQDAERDLMRAKIAQMMSWVDSMTSGEAKALAAELKKVKESIRNLAVLLRESTGLDAAGVKLLAMRLRHIADGRWDES